MKTDLTFSSTPSCRICTLKALWSSSWHHSCWFLLPSFVVERFNGLEGMDLFPFFWAMHFGHLSKGLEHREKPSAFSFRQLRSLVLTHCHYNRVENVQKAAACPVTPSTNPGMSVLLHSSFWLLLPSSEFWCWNKTTSLMMKELKLFLLAALIISCSELSYQANDTSPKKVPWFILFKTFSIRSLPSTRWQLVNVHLMPLSVSHYIC